MKEKIKYLILILLLSNCSKDISFDPTVTIGKELIRFFYEESKETLKIVEASQSNNSVVERGIIKQL